MGKSLHEYSVLDSPGEPLPARAKPIQGIAVQKVTILTDNTDFADEAYQSLLAKCPQGRITNVSARYSTDLGILAYQNELVINGICIEEN
jgi:hypothetical protein